MVRSRKGSVRSLVGFGRVVAAFLGLAAVASAALPACSSDEPAPGCAGVVVDGECQKKCDEATCAAPGMKCKNNACTQPCTDVVKDCPAGKYCYATGTDDGTQGQFCDWAPFAQGGKRTGQYDTCAADAECDEMRGFKCLAGTCKLTGCTSNADCAAVPGVCVKDAGGDSTKNYCEKGTKVLGLGEKCTKSLECDADQSLGCVGGECAYVGCTQHSDCASIGLCKAAKNAEGADVLACTKGTTYPKGQFGTACTGGATAKECDEANNFVCIGAGAGDIEAYCTKAGCQADADCADGYRCSTVRTSRPPCATACNITGQPSAANCVKATDIGAGKEYSCGPVTLLRNICMKREFCGECQSDDDCRAMPNQLCASDGKGHKYCTVICDPNVSNACPWGSAAECAVHDTALGKPTCAHRFGACKGTGKGCEPCLDDKDCPTGLCLSTDYGGEHYCVDLAVKCDCAGLSVDQGVSCDGGGCPKTPGTLDMKCYGGDSVKASNSPLYQTCVGADALNGAKAPYTLPGCWPLQ